MHRDDALALACGPLCLQIHSILPAAMRGATIAVEKIQPGDLVTWFAKNTRLYTLIQTEQGTRVYDHADDLLYFASPNVELDRACPPGHAFLCQTVCDRQTSATQASPPTPRLLVMDLVAPVIESPHSRNEALRRLAHVFPHTCHVQWAGERQALESFLPSVPHDVECVVALRAPLQLVRDAPAFGIAALQALDLPR